MEPFIVFAASIVLVVTGVVDPEIKDKKTLVEVYETQVSTPAPRLKKNQNLNQNLS